MRPRSLGLLSRVPLLFDRLHRVPGRRPLLAQQSQLVFIRPGFLLPSFHVNSDFVALRFEINERFLERGCKLFLGKEVLLDGPNTRFLVLGVLRADGIIFVMRKGEDAVGHGGCGI